MTNQEYITQAREEYQHEGDVEIDDEAVVSRGSDPGAYVQAWVWVSDPVAQANLAAYEADGTKDDETPDLPYMCSEDDPDAPDEDPINPKVLAEILTKRFPWLPKAKCPMTHQECAEVATKLENWYMEVSNA